MEILFHDVDGCLNADSTADIPRGGESFTPEQLRKLEQLGRSLDASRVDLMAINTGRSMADTVDLVGAINSRKLGYLVAEHGAEVYDVSQASLLPPSPHIASELNDVQQFIEWYQHQGHELLAQSIGESVPVVAKNANLTLRLHAELCGKTILQELSTLITRHSPFSAEGFVYHHSESDGFVDVMSSIDKADGIRWVTSAVQPAESIHTIAVGNGLNDLPMLQAADTPLCPANADAPVIEACAHGVVSPHAYVDATIAWLDSRPG